MPEPIALGWAVEPALVGWRALIWRDGEVIYKGFARSRRSAEALAQSILRKRFPELYRTHEKEVA